MSAKPPVRFIVFPDDCDAYGHLNQAAVVRLFERARWAALAAGPGMDVFTRNGVWPAVRKTTVEHRAQAFTGDELRFDLALAHHGRTSFTLRQIATRAADETTVADGEFVFVCVGEDGRPRPVPPEVSRFFGARPSQLPGETRHVAVRDVSLAVDMLGDGDPVLFVHGFPLDRTLWRQTAGTLTGWRRVAPDLRGFGLSGATEQPADMAAYAHDLAALLEALGIERAVVCGLSMGGYVAFELWRHHRDRVRALVLMSTRAAPDDGAQRERRDALIARVRRDGSTAMADELLPKLLAPITLSTQPQVVDRLRRMAAASPPEGLAQALAAMRDREDARPLLETITVPTLVVAGAEDGLIPPAETRALAAAIRNAHLAMIPDAGHLPPLEQPINTSRVVGEFLEALH